MANAMAEMIGVDEELLGRVAVKLNELAAAFPELELVDLAEHFDNKREVAVAGFITGFLAKAYTLTQDFEDNYGRPQSLETNVHQRDEKEKEGED